VGRSLCSSFRISVQLRKPEIAAQRSAHGFAVGPNFVIRVPPDDVEVGPLTNPKESERLSGRNRQTTERVLSFVLILEAIASSAILAIGHVVVRQKALGPRLADRHVLEVGKPIEKSAMMLPVDFAQSPLTMVETTKTEP
jgi:hypothetical protein